MGRRWTVVRKGGRLKPGESGIVVNGRVSKRRNSSNICTDAWIARIHRYLVRFTVANSVRTTLVRLWCMRLISVWELLSQVWAREC